MSDHTPTSEAVIEHPEHIPGHPDDTPNPEYVTVWTRPYVGAADW
jgi:hypothetical protein